MSVLITGSSRNIGQALAIAFARTGRDVVVNGRNLGAAEKVAASIVSSGGRAIAVSADVSSEASVLAMVEEAAEKLSPVEVLINNAALRYQGDVESTSTEDWTAVLDVTLTGAFHCSKAVVPRMRAAGTGRIVNIIGVTGELGAANRCAVVAAKSGLIGLTKALALELAETGITVNGVSPGLIDTERGAWTSGGDQPAVAQAYSGVIKRIPVGRPGHISEVVHAVQSLVHEEAAYITGQILRVNGGLYC